jgi:DNA repair protein RadA/Sms
VLLAGEPGAGKSTLLLAAAAGCAGAGLRVLLVTGEESVAQIRLRAERTGSLSENVLVAAETELGAVVAHVEAHRPDVVILDSVQTVASAETEGAPGGVAQVREVAGVMTRAAKERGHACLLVGHVTKDGAIAGPRALEHLVDVVLHFEGERASTLRLLRGVKNRFGATDEIGCFEMTETGIVGVADPTGRFLSRSSHPASATAGSCVTVAVEGRRSLLAEVQALISPINSQQPQRRSVSGLDAARVAMAVAVVERHGHLKLGPADIYAATVAGMRLTDPAADLALALALASAHHNRPLPQDLVALGEVGLAGEIRPVRDVARRLRAASRLGFGRALVPPGAGSASDPAAGEVFEAADVATALRLVDLQEMKNRG